MIVLFWVIVLLMLAGVFWVIHFLIGLKLVGFFLNYELSLHKEGECYICKRHISYSDIIDHIWGMGYPSWEGLSSAQRETVRKQFQDMESLDEERNAVLAYEESLKHCQRRAKVKASLWVVHLPKVLSDQALGKALDKISDEKKRLREVEEMIRKYRSEELTQTQAWDKLFESFGG